MDKEKQPHEYPVVEVKFDKTTGKLMIKRKEDQEDERH
jgi:hypothetical protein